MKGAVYLIRLQSLTASLCMNNSSNTPITREFCSMSLSEREEVLIKKLNDCKTPQALSELLLREGKNLPMKERNHFSEEEKVRGCQSLLYCKVSIDEDHKVSVHMFSDALLSRGLAHIVYRLYEGCLLRDLLLFKPSIVEKVDILSKLSIGRTQGLSSLLQAISQRALTSMRG